MNEGHISECLPFALTECGYQLIDTATCYRNESAIGSILYELIASGRLKRSKIFVTSKISPREMKSFASVTSAIEESCSRLRLETIDLMLLHWPGAAKFSPESPEHRAVRKEAWRALEEAALRKRLCKIGVSNFTVAHMREIFGYCRVEPFLSQIEIHPLYLPEEEIEFCRVKGLHIQAYSSFAEGRLLSEPFVRERCPELLVLAQQRHSSLSCLFLQWATQKAFLVIPKSNTRKHILENMQSLWFPFGNFLATAPVKREKFCWDPATVL